MLLKKREKNQITFNPHFKTCISQTFVPKLIVVANNEQKSLEQEKRRGLTIENASVNLNGTTTNKRCFVHLVCDSYLRQCVLVIIDSDNIIFTLQF